MLKKIFDPNKKYIKNLEEQAIQVEEKAEEMSKLSDEELKQKTVEFKERYNKGESLNDFKIEAFAVCREAAKRVLGMEPYRVQIMGSLTLHEGDIPEMKTGEGKTLTATMAVYLNALAGRGVHVITVNEYLSERDANEMGKLYEWLGLTVGLNKSSLSKEEKRDAYSKDITYSTNSELGFDYLRDNMVKTKEAKVQRPLYFAVIDEVDSVLIDEARTPLIISKSGNKPSSLYIQADQFASVLDRDEEFTYDEEKKIALLTEKGIELAEQAFNIDNLYDIQHITLNHAISNALTANFVLQKDVDYIVNEGEVLIIDSLTGRAMEGRRFSEGLHQAIEAKEKLEIKKESVTIASITFQNYFRMYEKLSGMTGTAKTEEEEFLKIYNMEVIVIPTNKPISRIDKPDLIYKTLAGKYSAIVKATEEYHKTGQPVLIGTVSVETSEVISKMLTEANINHEVLNAKNHEREAEIISKAGHIGSVTVATNMAGRGTDIKPGPGVLERGGLAVIGTERHESRRIDNQLRGRSGRQGNVGVTQFYISLEDEIMIKLGTDKLLSLMEVLKMEEDEAIEIKAVSKAVETAQKQAEGSNYEARKRVLQYDDVLREQRNIIYEERDRVLESENTWEISEKMIKETVSNLVSNFNISEEDELNYLMETLDKEVFPGLSNFKKKIIELEDKTGEKTSEFITEKVIEAYKFRTKDYSEEDIKKFERAAILHSIDVNWMKHISLMAELKEGIHLRAYGHVEPIKEYEREGFEMFGQTIAAINAYAEKCLLLTPIDKILDL